MKPSCHNRPPFAATPIQQSDMGQSLDGAAGKSVRAPTADEKRAVLVEAGDEVRAYLNTLGLNDKEFGRLRAVILGWEQHKAELAMRAADEAERIRKEEAEKLAQQAANDQRGKANAGITTPACEQTTAAPDAGIMPVELIAGNAASAASTPPIQDQFASAGKMIDAPSMLTEFLALQPLNMAEKKAWRAVIEKWEPYRIKVEAARALKAAA